MRKILLVLFGITTMFGFNKVHAADIKFEYNTNLNQIKPFIEEIGYEKLNHAITENIKYYNEHLASDYPYYFISIWYSEGLDKYHILLTALDDTYLTDDYYFRYFSTSYYVINQVASAWCSARQISYDVDTDTISLITYNENGYSIDLFNTYEGKNVFQPYSYYYSNFDLYYRGSLYTEEISNGPNAMRGFKYDDNLLIPTYDDSSLYSVHKANADFLVEPYYLYDDNEYLQGETFTTIDLNQYSYVALSLKDYSKTETFFTNVYVKGNYCITPVYNYGMTEKTEYYPGYQIDRCSPYYEDFTLVRTYILEQDLKNNAIYYLKAYDKTKDNVVKVDSSVFNITYITEESKDNPYVSIGGKTYPTISYDNLSSSATKSEEEDYISGVVCQVGDFNCYTEHNPSNIFDEIFSSPLKFLDDIWESVTSIFKLITEFISLLPPIMQSFLYLSFMVAIILGLLKIIL